MRAQRYRVYWQEMTEGSRRVEIPVRSLDEGVIVRDAIALVINTYTDSDLFPDVGNASGIERFDPETEEWEDARTSF